MNESQVQRPINGMRVLVIGGCGFIGGHLVRSLAKSNEVVALDYVQPSAPIQGVKYVQQDLRSRLDRSRLPENVDVVFHLASAFSLDTVPPLGNLAITTVSVLDALEYAVKAYAKHFLFTSTGSVYRLSDEPLKEDVPLEPKQSFYSAAKYSAELFVGLYSDRVPGTVVRLFGVYGKGTSNPWGRMAEDIAGGRPLKLRPKGTPRINPIYVKDLVPYLEAAAVLGRHETVNLGGERVVDNVEAAKLMGEIQGRKPVIEWMAEDVKDIVGDVSKMLRLFAYRPRWSLEQGLRAWFLHDDVPDEPAG